MVFPCLCDLQELSILHFQLKTPMMSQLPSEVTDEDISPQNIFCEDQDILVGVEWRNLNSEGSSRPPSQSKTQSVGSDEN